MFIYLQKGSETWQIGYDNFTRIDRGLHLAPGLQTTVYYRLVATSVETVSTE